MRHNVWALERCAFGFFRASLANRGLAPREHLMTECWMISAPQKMPRFGRKEDVALLVEEVGMSGLSKLDGCTQDAIDLGLPRVDDADKVASGAGTAQRNSDRDRVAIGTGLEQAPSEDVRSALGT